MSVSPVRYAAYSVAASVATLGLKFGAYFLTDSVGLLSDATESFVNLAAGLFALVAVIVAGQPADEDHAYGHGKIEYFSSGTEGLLIIVAAAGIVWASVNRFIHPAALQHLGLGIGMALAASGINWITARSLLRAAKRFDSITLEADAKHLMTDVWTSGGLVAGLSVLLFAPASWAVLDPLIALVMAINIVFTGVSLVRRSLSGLMDQALPQEELKLIAQAITSSAGPEVQFHALRSRKSGARRFVDFHILVPGDSSVAQSHELCCRVEAAIHEQLPGAMVTIHVEPLEDAASHDGWMVGGACSQKLKGAGDESAD